MFGGVLRKYRCRMFFSSFMAYVIAFFIVISHSFYAYTTQRLLVNTIYVLLSILPFIYLLGINKKCYKKEDIIRVCVYYIILIPFFLFNVDVNKYSSFIFRYLIFVPLMIFFFIEMSKTNRILFLYNAIEEIVLLISIISMFFWLFGTTLHIISPTGQTWVVWGNDYRSLYYGMYIEVPVRWLDTSLYRNVGIFCEAPAFALFLSISFSYELLVREKISIFRTIVLIITMLSTGSTTALVTIVYCVTADLWNKFHKKKSSALIMKLGVIIIGTVSLIFIVMFSLNPAKLASVSLRKQDYITGFIAWIRSPIFGYGYMISSDVVNSGYSNSITQILIGGGLWLMSIYVFSLYESFAFFSNERKMRWWVILMCFLFSVSVIGYAYIALTFISLGIALFLISKGVRNR